MVHSPGRFAKLVIDESERKQGLRPQACADAKPLILKEKLEFSTAQDGYYQLPPGLKSQDVDNRYNTKGPATITRPWDPSGRACLASAAGAPAPPDCSSDCRRWNKPIEA